MHGQSTTCTDIVNGQEWLESVTRLLDRATLAARIAGKTHATTAEWFAARDDARKAEDVLVGVLAQAAGRMARDSAAALVQQGAGFEWDAGLRQWRAGPAPRSACKAAPNPKPALAVEQLEALGWRWSGLAAHWVEPAPGKIDPRNAEAAKVLEAEGYVWGAQTEAWLPPAPRYDPVHSAAWRVANNWPHGTAAPAVMALKTVLEGNPPAWDAEECRDAAMAVLRASRCGKWGGELGAALERLSEAVVRQQ